MATKKLSHAHLRFTSAVAIDSAEAASGAPRPFASVAYSARIFPEVAMSSKAHRPPHRFDIDI
ncbi:hypothetical protein GCM10008020_28820 [Massilia psychrophila]|nr:hypothetical protein GCM10008020_28820 [Massilia psychrophila]